MVAWLWAQFERRALRSICWDQVHEAHVVELGGEPFSDRARRVGRGVIGDGDPPAAREEVGTAAEQVVAKAAHRLVEGRLLVAGDHDELDLSEGGQRRHATILAAACENHVRRV